MSTATLMRPASPESRPLSSLPTASFLPLRMYAPRAQEAPLRCVDIHSAKAARTLYAPTLPWDCDLRAWARYTLGSRLIGVRVLTHDALLRIPHEDMRLSPKQIVQKYRASGLHVVCRDP